MSSRNKLKFVAVSSLIVLFGGYSLFWYIQANSMQKKIEKKISETNEKSTDRSLIQYERIEKSGYPFDIVLSLINPKISDISRHENTRTLIQDGKILSVHSVLGRTKEILITGKTCVTDVNESTKLPFELIIEGDVAIKSKFDDLYNLFNPLTKENSIRDFDVLISSLRCVKIASKEETEIFSIKQSEMSYKSYPEQLVTFSGDLDINFQHAHESWKYSSFLEYLKSELPNTDWNSLSNLHEDMIKKYFSSKLNFNFDVIMKASDKVAHEKILNSTHDFFSNPQPFSLELKKLDITDSNGITHYKGAISSSQISEKETKVDFKYDIKTNFTKNSYENFIAAASYFRDHIVKIKTTDESVLKVKRLFRNNFDDVVKIVPKFYQLGNLSSGCNVSFQRNKDNNNESFAISDFGFTSDLYGMLFNANFNNVNGIQQGTGSFTLINYQPLIRDVLSYFNRLSVIYNACKHKEDQRINPLSEETINKILGYLVRISDAPENPSSDLKITIQQFDNVSKIGKMSETDFTNSTVDLIEAIKQDVMPQPKNQKQTPQN